jgi:ornithine cyclodeaminase/alanine dehydrogenase-like protein (mu-crystallin family)
MNAPAGQSETRILTRADVERVLDPRTCIDAVEEAFRVRGTGGRIESAVLGLHGEGGGFHVKAATMLGDRGYFAAKLNANFPANPTTNGLPTIQGVLGLFDATNGAPLAVMDSIGITLLRTAAATGVAARHLARGGPATVTIIGCGAQALPQLAALAVVRPIEMVHAVDRDAAAAERFATAAAARFDIAVVAAVDMERATRASNIVVTCTTSRAAFLDVPHIAAGTFVAAVGADNEEKSEIAPALMRAGAVVVDHRGQCETIGDLHHAIAAGVMRADDIRGELSEVVAGSTRGRRDDDDIIIFDSTGVALEDVAAAAVVYERAVAAGIGQVVRFGA